MKFEYKESLEFWKKVNNIVETQYDNHVDSIDSKDIKCERKNIKTPIRIKLYEKTHGYNDSVPVWIEAYRVKLIYF